MARNADTPLVVIVFGDEPFAKVECIKRVLDGLLPPEVDRTMALSEYDGAQPEGQGGPTFARVADDLRTLPFLADRRVVLVREADAFVQTSREQLERYVADPAPTGTLVMECKSFPKTTRLYNAIVKIGGALHECRKLNQRDAIDFILSEARRQGKRIDPTAASRLADLVGAAQGVLSSEIEKLSLYAADKPSITDADISELVGLSREEKIFAVMDAALTGHLSEAVRLWHHVLQTDPNGVYKALGGMAFVLRRLLNAHRMVAEGMPIAGVAPKVMMFRRERELKMELSRNPAERLRSLLARLAELDKASKLGLRSLETGIEAILIEVARPAA